MALSEKPFSNVLGTCLQRALAHTPLLPSGSWYEWFINIYTLHRQWNSKAVTPLVMVSKTMIQTQPTSLRVNFFGYFTIDISLGSHSVVAVLPWQPRIAGIPLLNDISTTTLGEYYHLRPGIHKFPASLHCSFSSLAPLHPRTWVFSFNLFTFQMLSPYPVPLPESPIPFPFPLLLWECSPTHSPTHTSPPSIPLRWGICRAFIGPRTSLSGLLKVCVTACHFSAFQPLYSVWAITIAIAFQDQRTYVVWYSPYPSTFLCALVFTSCAPSMLTLFLLLFKHCRFAVSFAWNTFWQIWHSLFQHCHFITVMSHCG